MIIITLWYYYKRVSFSLVVWGGCFYIYCGQGCLQPKRRGRECHGKRVENEVPPQEFLSLLYIMYELLRSAPRGQFLETARIAVIGDLNADNFADDILSMIGTLNINLEILL